MEVGDRLPCEGLRRANFGTDAGRLSEDIHIRRERDVREGLFQVPGKASCVAIASGGEQVGDGVERSAAITGWP